MAIVGAGLIGGSFGLALKRNGFDGRIIGVSSPAASRAALERGAIDEALPLEQAVPQADLIYLSQSIGRIIDSLRRLDPLVRPDALVTDAGSTKAAIVRAAGVLENCQFLGGHPMAGKEKRGAEEADADLFRGRTYVITPQSPDELETEAARGFLVWLERIGAVPVVLTPAEHDRVVSYTSHLAQLASTALAATVAEHLKETDHLKVAGPGLIDSTRLALSSYEIWRDILATNSGCVERAIGDYIQKLEYLRENLRSRQMAGEFAAAASFASQIRRTE
ncbi:MAG: prephenate dehydrogenase [Bryobacteraceae bacterium]